MSKYVRMEMCLQCQLREQTEQQLGLFFYLYAKYSKEVRDAREEG